MAVYWHLLAGGLPYGAHGGHRRHMGGGQNYDTHQPRNQMQQLHQGNQHQYQQLQQATNKATDKKRTKHMAKQPALPATL